jgi:hypothetical protein
MNDRDFVVGQPSGSAGPLLGMRTETVVALVVIAALLVPLSALSQPADQKTAGGTLARMRSASGLAQAGLGDVDATGETLRLATLGLKNVAVALLGDRINHYKMVKDWTSLSAALEQMTKLQPHFFSVWTSRPTTCPTTSRWSSTTTATGMPGSSRASSSSVRACA